MLVADEPHWHNEFKGAVPRLQPEVMLLSPVHVASVSHAVLLALARVGFTETWTH